MKHRYKILLMFILFPIAANCSSEFVEKFLSSYNSKYEQILYDMGLSDDTNNQNTAQGPNIKEQVKLDSKEQIVEDQQIESEINNTVEDTVSKIKTLCPDDKTDAPCDNKAKVIQQIEQLAKDTLEKLKDLGKEQYN